VEHSSVWPVQDKEQPGQHFSLLVGTFLQVGIQNGSKPNVEQKGNDEKKCKLVHFSSISGEGLAWLGVEGHRTLRVVNK
jgi:hypothetical protein